MVDGDLDNVMRLAQRESARSGHFYVGVEHLFIALTKMKGGVTIGALEAHGITPRFVRYMIRQELGRGDDRRFWPGFRETPRLHEVLRLARELARLRGATEPAERDLFLAILQEGNSLPIRVLDDMDVDRQQLQRTAEDWSEERRPSHPEVPIQPTAGVELASDEVVVLKEMFRGYGRVAVERQLEGGYSSAKVVVARPYKLDGRPDASVVVKLDERQAILYEQMRYDSFVKDTLPPTTSRVTGNPVVPDQLPIGGLKYTFVRSIGEAGPVDLAAYARERGPAELANLIWNGLYKVFRDTWWLERQSYRFGTWQEYKLLLPPALILEAAENLGPPQRQIEPLGYWSRRGQFKHGDVVALQDFTVRYVYPSRGAIQVTAGAGPEAANYAGKVEVRGVNLASAQFFRGNRIERIGGRVLATRDDLLRQQVMALEPDFDAAEEWLPPQPDLPNRLPNPLARYSDLLERRMSGTLCTIHGDLHLHNILIGPGGYAWLIDFAWTREGHTLFDWAVLEASLLVEIVVPLLESDAWEDIWPVLQLLNEINLHGSTVPVPAWQTTVEQALMPILTVREIVAECLADAHDWSEYFTALALCALRVLGWDTASLRARRLLFLVSALSMAARRGRDGEVAPRSDADVTEIHTGVALEEWATDSSWPSPVEEAAGGRPEDYTSPETTSVEPVAVRFSVYHPKTLVPGDWRPFHAYVFRQVALEEVLADARNLFGDYASSPGARRLADSSASASVTVTATPGVAGFEFNPPSLTVDFREFWHRLDFRMRAVQAEHKPPGSLLGDVPASGSLVFTAGGVLVAEVPVSVAMADSPVEGEVIGGTPYRPFDAIFASYSRRDRHILERLARVSKLMRLRFLHNVILLQSRHGGQASEELLKMIAQADVFQLFWSAAAAASSRVTQEWQYALALNRDETSFIRPVYWTLPMPPPPPELSHLTFVYRPELQAE